MRSPSYSLRPRPESRARAALTAVLAALVAALCLTGLAALPASAQQSPPTDIALAWGLNDSGQLGDGTFTDHTTPVNVHLPAGTQLTAIAGGFFHSLALTSDGRVLAWGSNTAGQLGDGTTTDSSTPVEVHLPAGTHATALAGGGLHSLAVTSDGRVLAWGLNNLGQLGDGTTTNRSTPVEVHLPAGTHATAVAAGQRHSLALTSDGRVLAWGENSSGQLGDGTTTNRSTPVEVHLPAGTQATAISGGFDHSLALTSDGHVLAWGYNGFGQLGDGTITNRSTPVEVLLPSGVRATAIAGDNGYHSLAVTSDGRVLAWGRNSLGQLGDGSTTNSSTPVEVLLPSGTQATAVATGYDHSLAVTSDGHVLAWGRNTFGELGDGSTTNSSTPVEVLLPSGVHATAIAAGNYHSLALAVRAASTTTLTASPTTATPGQPVTLSAHVTCTGGTPTGDVTFFDGTTAIGTATLDAQGNATLTTTSLSLGTHQITAHYQGDANCPPSDSAPVTVTIEEAPQAALTLQKQVVTSGPFKVGDTVTYAYTVSNSGTIPLNNVTVADNLVTGITCDTTTLTPGQSTTCHGSHTITQADVTPCKTSTAPVAGRQQVVNCQVTNTAHAAATDPNGNQVTSNQATATITVQVQPAVELALAKRVVSVGPFRVGDQVAYAYTVTNTGSVALNNVTVADNLVTGITCDTTTLASGQSTTCTGTHTITQADVTPCKTAKERGGNHGKGKHPVMRCEVTNTATASATDPSGNQITSNQATATITVTVEKKKEKEHCRKHHSNHKRAHGGDRCDDHDGHHRRAAQEA